MRGLRESVFIFILIIVTGCSGNRNGSKPEFKQAEINGKLVNEGFDRCLKFTNGWLTLADKQTGLIPRNINDSISRDIWNAKDCAADNYPFMVLTTALLDKNLFKGIMTDMLNTEIRLTSRIGSLPDTYSFSKGDFANNDVIMSDIIFGSAEYIKDGLIPLTEWLGPSQWSERMITIIDEVWKHAEFETPGGKIISIDPEVNGDMLQSLSRVYWITGDNKYLEYAIRLGDYYLLGNNHPTKNFRVLRLRDHGCEIVSGLCELYATVSFADPQKREEYRKPVHEMLDRILEVGRNEDGLFYNSIDPVRGEPVDEGIADNFGYTLNGFYTVYLIDNEEKYRSPVLKANSILNSKYRNYAWEGTSSDGYADAIEGALNLYAREPLESTEEWLDSEILVMWNKQQNSGIIEGWHGDGNFARTTIMYCLWKTQGTYLVPWNNELELGAVQKDSTLYISLFSKKDWEGKLMFDRKRHKEFMNLPLDWPRINQFPEYFTIENGNKFRIKKENSRKEYELQGNALKEGFPIRLKAGDRLHIIVSRAE
ncbi:MAG TPA: hypothetical protein VMV47_18725 [Bacteroidales bacterium]|nr:hypothetical protein [Bacteroidales bacterium]